MPLIARNGKLLRTAAGLASSLDCCCGDDPCNCNQDLTYFFQIEVTGFEDEVIFYRNPGICPGCPEYQRLRFDGFNGTYFVPFIRNCNVSPPRFVLNTTHTLKAATIASEQRAPNQGCFASFASMGNMSLSFAGTSFGTTQIVRASIGVPVFLSLPIQWEFSVLECSDEPIAESGSGNWSLTNYDHDNGCAAFTQSLGSISWSIVPGEPP